jgi:NADH-quinone oxidoreductase subunit N
MVPALILLVTGALLILTRRLSRPYFAAWMGVAGSLLAGLRLWEHLLSAWGWFESDPISQFLSLLILVGAALTLPVARAVSARDDSTGARTSTDYGFVLIAAAGMMLAVSTRHLLVLFAAVEVVSYALSRSCEREKPKRTILASASILVGLALFRVASGSFDVAAIEAALVSRYSGIGLAPVLALVLLVVGIFLKLVPPLLRLGAIGVSVALTAQVALFGALLRMRGWLLVLEDVFAVVLLGVALVSMFIGNLRALRRGDLQGVLSSSFLVHIGLLALGMVAGGEAGRAAVIFYLFALVVMGLGAWSAAVGDWKGRGWSHSFRAVAMSFLLLSMAGIPITMGFVGRTLIMTVSVPAIHLGLVAIALLNLLACFYYYMKLILNLFAGTLPMDDGGIKAGRELTVAVAVCSLVVLAVGVWPEPLLAVVKQVAMEFF